MIAAPAIATTRRGLGTRVHLLGKLRSVELIGRTPRGVCRQVPGASAHPFSEITNDQGLAIPFAKLGEPCEDDEADEEDEQKAGRHRKSA